MLKTMLWHALLLASYYSLEHMYISKLDENWLNYELKSIKIGANAHIWSDSILLITQPIFYPILIILYTCSDRETSSYK